METIPLVQSSAKVVASVRNILMPHGRPRCLRCQQRDRISGTADGRYWCGRCRRKWSLRQCCGFGGAKLGWDQIHRIGLAFSRSWPVAIAATTAGVSPPTVRRYYGLLRGKCAAWSHAFDGCLSGDICADESYVGRQRTGNQAIVIGAVNRAFTEVVFRIIRTVDQGTVEKFLYDTVAPWSQLTTDGHTAYADVTWMGFSHRFEIHERGEFSETCPIERVWALLKTFLHRTYHHVWRERLAEYLAEFRFKFMHPLVARSPLYYFRFLAFTAPTAC